VQAGTAPEVTYSSSNVQRAVTELNALIPRVASAQIRDHVRDTLKALRQLSGDAVLQAECTGAINIVDTLDRNERDVRPGTAPGVVASPLPQSSEALR
jgi:hypothetical protein